jgi:hypothetical protein
MPTTLSQITPATDLTFFDADARSNSAASVATLLLVPPDLFIMGGLA